MESSEQAGLTSEPKAHAKMGSIAYPWLKSYPKQIDWFQHFDPAPLPSFLDEAAARFPARPATGFFGKTLSYAELQDAVSRATKGLQGLGRREGDARRDSLPELPGLHRLLLCDPEGGRNRGRASIRSTPFRSWHLR